jgi:hypothetical protein
MVKQDSTTMLAVGNTAYKYTLGTVGIDESASAMDAHIFEVSPNPAHAEINIHLELKSNSNVLLTFGTINGQRLKVLENDVHTAGSYHWKLDAAQLAEGVYYLHLRTNIQNFGKRILVQH